MYKHAQNTIFENECKHICPSGYYHQFHTHYACSHEEDSRRNLVISAHTPLADARYYIHIMHSSTKIAEGENMHMANDEIALTGESEEKNSPKHQN